MMSFPRARLAASAISILLVAAACGSGDGATDAGAPAASPDGVGVADGTGSDNTGSDSADDDTATGVGTPAANAAETAAATMADLEQTNDVRTFEVLDVGTGEATSINGTVTGDRPVLLWFWAPH